MISTEPTALIPVTLLTGFLGSGKTTVLNHVLKQPGMAATAVIVNEFGEIGLDHLLVERSSEDIVLLNSGCLCCTVRGDIVDTLTNLFVDRVKGKVPFFTRVAIETTGLADPAPILHTLMTDPIVAARYVLDGVVTTVDAAMAPARSIGSRRLSSKRRWLTACSPDQDRYCRARCAASDRGAAQGTQPERRDRVGCARRHRFGFAVQYRFLRPDNQKPRCAALAARRIF